MVNKTFLLHVNGHQYELEYWVYPWVRTAFNDLKQGGKPLNLRGPNSLNIWLHAGDDVQYEFSDPTDPEIPEYLTAHELLHLEDIIDGDRRYGYRVLDVDLNDGGMPILAEWDDPNPR